MDRTYRQEVLKRVHPRVLERSVLKDLDREYSLYEIAIITRAGPARMLGLTHKGHLGVGADADVTIYTPGPDKRAMFELPRCVSKVAVFRLTIVDVQGFGRQKGRSEVYRGHELTVNLVRKVQLQIAVNEDFVEPTVNAIMEAGRTGAEGRIGDGKIFILPLEDCLRIRTGERGPEAI